MFAAIGWFSKYIILFLIQLVYTKHCFLVSGCILFYTTDSYKYGNNNMSFTHLWLYAILLQHDIHNKTSIAHKLSRTQAQKCIKPKTLCSTSSTVIIIYAGQHHIFLIKICFAFCLTLGLWHWKIQFGMFWTSNYTMKQWVDVN